MKTIDQTHICRQFPMAKCSDNTYTCPPEAWVESVFRAYKTLMKWLKVLSWRKHHDCDDKAGGFRWLYCAWHEDIVEVVE